MTKRKPKVETPEQKTARLARNKKARARHWRKTGVSDRTVRWMDDMGML
jgi:hypothetical protein